MSMTRVVSVFLLAAAAWGGLSEPAAAQVALTKNSDLNFGSMVAGSSAGTVTVSPTGAVSSTGGVTLVLASTTPATYTLTRGRSGNPSMQYTIQLPTTVTISSGANSMTVGGFQNTPPTTGNLPKSASIPIGVGATLDVGANQPSGSYSGSFLMTVVIF